MKFILFVFIMLSINLSAQTFNRCDEGRHQVEQIYDTLYNWEMNWCLWGLDGFKGMINQTDYFAYLPSHLDQQLRFSSFFHHNI
ncbi:hypothetical protein LJC53_01260 [Bacteroidales bacterium OttesenSCG-928-C03]|nr:hypothetical protein [Bacteroidales bacterium OttesenSCG-928-E04]MDL2308194.1 hypothetical protein [Bacteroidales bacterium OttesenSCG-928-C03]